MTYGKKIDPPKKVMIGYCGDCEDGWVFFPDKKYTRKMLAIPCTCPGAMHLREKVAKYARDLQGQSWYRAAEEADRKRENRKLLTII
jgi:hypothetical protein